MQNQQALALAGKAKEQVVAAGWFRIGSAT